jgi:hypothetical protein
MKKLIIIALMVCIGCFPVPISKAMAASAPMLVPFEMMPDSLGHATTLVPPASRFITNHSLTASTPKTITVPAGANWVNFSAAANLWVNFNGGAAAVPSTDVTDGSGTYFNPPMMYVGPIYSGGAILCPALTTISVISDTTWVLTAMWFR